MRSVRLDVLAMSFVAHAGDVEFIVVMRSANAKPQAS